MKKEEMLLEALNRFGNFTTVTQEFSDEQIAVIYELMDMVEQPHKVNWAEQSASTCNLQNVSAMLPDLDIDKAEELAWETDYACFAVEEDGNEINKADAGAFFLEGYNYAKGNLR